MIGSYYNSFNPDNLSWDLDSDDSMKIVIKYNGIRAMSISLHEAIEGAGRKNVMKHVVECDRSPWLKRWTDEAMDEEIRILKGNLK